MEVRRNSKVETTVVDLADRARQATLSLYLSAAGLNGQEGIGSAAEVCQVLGSMRALVDNVVRCLPELAGWLEQQLLAGELSDLPNFDGLTQSMRDTTAALARARNVGAQLGRDLELAQTASKGFVSP